MKNVLLSSCSNVCIKSAGIFRIMIMIGIFCLAAFAQVNAQNITVRGKVSDDKGITLPGVSVKVKGATAGTATDAQGSYSISVPRNGTLEFSFLGFVTQEVAVNGVTILDVILKVDLQSLEEVVVTALGIERNAKSLAYSITQVKGDDFSKARENNLGTALSGRIAGVNATSGSTGPTSESRVVIRGNGSINGENQPLYVINDVPVANDAITSLNPDDIETISVLKGGTAAALYGSSASNGVILITTKAGKGQTGIGIELNSTYIAQTFTQNTDWQYEYGQGNNGQKPTTSGEATTYGRTSWGAKLDGTPVIQLDGVMRPYSAQKNNYKNFYNVGNNFANTVAFTGGSETANMRFSISNMDDVGLVPEVVLNRKTFNWSVNALLAKKLEFVGRVQYSLEFDKNRTITNNPAINPNGSVDMIATSLDVRTLAPGYDQNRFQTEWNDYNAATNPWYAATEFYNGQSTKRLIGNFSVKYNILPYLYASAQMGIDRADQNSKRVEPYGALYIALGSVSESQGWNYRRNGEVRLGFNKTILDLVNLNILVGGNQRYSPSSSISRSSGNLNVPFQYFIANGLTQTSSSSFRESYVNSVYFLQ